MQKIFNTLRAGVRYIRTLISDYFDFTSTCPPPHLTTKLHPCTSGVLVELESKAWSATKGVDLNA